MIKGTCQKQNLAQVVHDAILSPGSNWQEISSNKVQDGKTVDPQTDGWVFKSPPIGTKGESVIFQMKAQDLTKTPSSSVNAGGNHFYFYMCDNYTPSPNVSTNGTFENKSFFNAWVFATVDSTYCAPTSEFDYFIDVLDHRIMIVIQRHSETLTTHPQFIYIGYPDPETNLEGDNYTNQFICGSNLCIGNTHSGTGKTYWHKASNGTRNAYATVSCPLNSGNPTPMGLYLLTPITVNADTSSGTTNTGPLGVLSGIYGLPASSIVNNDTIMVGSDEYKVFNISQWAINYGGNYGGHAYLYYYHGVTPSFIAIKVN